MSDGGGVISGPWRATRLWNEIVRSFHAGMPCKRHRVRMKTVENCFSGAEAVDWLHKSLKKNPNFGQDVGKEQTVQLLQKILRAGIVECVHSSSSGSQNSLFGMASAGSGDTFVASDLYRFVDSAAENLRTPGKNKSPVSSRISSRREALAAMDNTPLRRSGGGGGARSTSEESNLRETADLEWETKSELSGLKKHRRRSMMAAMDCPVVPTPVASVPIDESDKRSYFQSLPPNSLIILDNDQTWREAFEAQLGSVLSAVHVRNLDVNVCRIIYNMTKVSSKGVVQLVPPSRQSDQDLPHWVLSAMKCLANWPRPMKMINGEDSSLPNYPGFIRDVFDVVKDYFQGLGAPLIPFDLFDMFESAYVKAESVKSRSVPLPSLAPVSSEYQRYLGTDLDGVAVAVPSQPQLQTSTPTMHEQLGPSHPHDPKFYMMRSNSSDAFLNLDGERVARVRQTQEVMPPQMSNASRTSSLHQGSTFDSTGNTTTSASLTLNADMSATAIMRNFLPPNTCFETVFMNEVPVTRIVPQKQNDTLHLTRPASRSHSRASSYTAIPTAWDTRSIATQTSQEEEQQQQQIRSRQPRWRRSSRLRKSIAVMDQRPSSVNSRLPPPPERSASANEISPILTPNPVARVRSSSCSRDRGGDYGVSTNPGGGGGGSMPKAFSSMDNLLDQPTGNEEDARFLRKYQRMSLCSARDSQGSLLERDNVILSKAVRKEKRRQREKRESGVGCKEKVYAEIKPGPSSSEYSPNSTSSSSNLGIYARRAPSVRYSSSRFQHLTVKTPLNPIDFPADMQYVRAEPYIQDGPRDGPCRGSPRELSVEGARSAVDSFKLLGLLLRPASRRKLQLLLKFMKRVSGNDQLTLRRDTSNSVLVLDMFVRIIIRPEVPATNYDGDISRKIVEFFIENYEAIWTPPESLRREVEDKVYQSLVSKRIRAGEDPYPVTFCRQITSTAYESDKREGGTRAALLDLLDHILSSERLSEKEKKKKLKKFKASYPEIYQAKFPNAEDEPDCMKQASAGNSSALARLPSLSRLKSVIRI